MNLQLICNDTFNGNSFEPISLSVLSLCLLSWVFSLKISFSLLKPPFLSQKQLFAYLQQGIRKRHAAPDVRHSAEVCKRCL